MRLITTLCFSTALAASMALAIARPALADTAAAQITVTGEGFVETKPDMATISIGVTTGAPTATEALAANSAQLKLVLDNLRAAGIEERDLQTTGLSLNPNYDSSKSYADGSAGFVASNQLNVRVRALDGLGAVLDAAVKDGANTLNGLSFGVTDQAPLLDEARKRAVAQARAKADLLSTAAGVKLGRVVSITEGGGFAQPGPMYRMDAAAASAPVPMATGEVSISATVTVVWEVAP